MTQTHLIENKTQQIPDTIRISEFAEKSKENLSKLDQEYVNLALTEKYPNMPFVWRLEILEKRGNKNFEIWETDLKSEKFIVDSNCRDPLNIHFL